MPESLSTIVDQWCPAFLHATNGEASTRPLGLRLEDRKDEHVFDFATKEGWFNAVQFCAVRDPRYQRAEVCWAECVETNPISVLKSGRATSWNSAVRCWLPSSVLMGSILETKHETCNV